MFKDPIVEDVRAARQRHAKKFNQDLEAIVADLAGERTAHEPSPCLPPSETTRRTVLRRQPRRNPPGGTATPRWP